MGIPKQGPVIAIDGPAGTGKSSATRRLAEKLGFSYVDTGALYRAIAFLIFPYVRNLSERQAQTLAIETAEKSHLEFRRMTGLNPVNRIFANGKDVTPFIRTNEMSMLASKISAIPRVRASLLGLQRRLGCKGKTILEGRDIGTVIFPDADIKFFLTASVNERVKRRLIELEALGSDLPAVEDLEKQIVRRDRDDEKRSIAPLKPAKDSIELDTSDLTLEQVVEKMATLYDQKLHHRSRPKKRLEVVS